jgi:hypothetical protein
MARRIVSLIIDITMDGENGKMTNINDHDLLIRMDTRLQGLLSDVKLLRDDTRDSVRTLEQTKVSLSDFNEAKLDGDRRHLGFENSLRELDKKYGEQTATLILKLDSVFKTIYIWTGGLIVLNILISAIIIPLVLKYLFKL